MRYLLLIAMLCGIVGCSKTYTGYSYSVSFDYLDSTTTIYYRPLGADKDTDSIVYRLMDDKIAWSLMAIPREFPKKHWWSSK